MRARKQIVVNHPVARDQGLLIETVADETVIYDLETKQAHCLKALAAAAFAYADGKNTTAEIAELASYRLGHAVTETEVADAISQLGDCGLLDTSLVIHNGSHGISRRDAVKRIGAVAGAVAAAPLITSIIAPTAAMAGNSVIPTGCTGCGQNKDCASNHCCQTVSGKQCNETCCVGQDNSCHLTTVGTVNTCTVSLSGCPCVCGSPGCSPTPDGTCCPAGSTVCCTVGP
jgi:hypothetical protein